MSSGPQNAPQAPRPLAMLLCDTATQDAATGKCNILGTFDACAATQFPANIKLGVFIVLTDCRGNHMMRLRLVKAAQDEVNDTMIVEATVEVKSADPLQDIPIPLEFRGPIPEPGVYYLQLLDGNDDAPLIERRLSVKLKPAPAPPEQ